MVDKQTQEIYNDIVRISDILIEKIKQKGYKASNDTAHGRIIFQLLWFKQEIDNKRLKLPVNKEDRSSLAYIYTNSEISDIEDNQLHMHELMVLTDNNLLFKPEHYPEMINYIIKLLGILKNPPRKLNEREQELIVDLKKIIPHLEAIDVIPYKDFKGKKYKGLWFSYDTWDGSSLDNIPEAGNLIKRIHCALVDSERIYRVAPS